MVRELRDAGRRLFQCEECAFAYLTKSEAEACEAYCTANSSCSLEITQQAVPLSSDVED